MSYVAAEVDPRRRADLFDPIAASAEVLDAAIKETDGLATRLTRDRHSIGECRRQADQAAQALRDRLVQAYTDPAATEAAWARLADERDIAGAGEAVTHDPAALGPLKGRRRFFDLLADRERVDAIAAARHVREAGPLAWDRAIARDLDRAATFKLDSLEAGPELTGTRQVLAERGTEHRVSDLRDQAACRTMLTAELKSRDPSAAAAWEQANQRSVERDRGPSLGR